MPKRGQKFVLYGAFSSKSAAERAEREHPGSFIVRRRVRGSVRWVVLKRKS
jgi:hypothetical protein